MVNLIKKTCFGLFLIVFSRALNELWQGVKPRGQGVFGLFGNPKEGTVPQCPQRYGKSQSLNKFNRNSFLKAPGKIKIL